MILKSGSISAWTKPADVQEATLPDASGHSCADGGQYHSVQMPQDMSNGTQSRLALPTAMSLDLPLIPDVPAEPTSTGPMDYPNTMYPNPVPNSTAMPAIGENYHLQAQPNSEVCAFDERIMPGGMPFAHSSAFLLAKVNSFSRYSGILICIDLLIQKKQSIGEVPSQICIKKLSSSEAQGIVCSNLDQEGSGLLLRSQQGR